jgi:hypothetical protein
MDVQSWFRKQLEEASPDFLRAMVSDCATLIGPWPDGLDAVAGLLDLEPGISEDPLARIGAV